MAVTYGEIDYANAITSVLKAADLEVLDWLTTRDLDSIR